MSRPALALAALFGLLAALVVALWWAGLEPHALETLAGRINAAGRITALLGTYLLFVQLILRTHVGWVVGALGKDIVKALHTKNAYLAFGLIGAHVVLQTVGYALADRIDLVAEIGLLLTRYEGTILALAGMALLAALTLLALEGIRHRVPWPLWRALHLYFYAAVALSLPHILATGSDFYDAPLAVVFWTALEIAVLAVLLVARVPPLWRAVTPAARPHPAVVAVGGVIIAAYLIGTIKLSPPTAATVAAGPVATPTGAAPGSTAIPVLPSASAAGLEREVDGELVGTQYGLLQVRVILSGTHIVDVEPIELPGGTKKSSGISGAAELWLRKRAIAAQSAHFEIVSGATYTSYAYQRSLDAALHAAGVQQP